MTGPEPVRAVRHAGALQWALSCAAKACACYAKGLTHLGDAALLDASELAAVAFPAGSDAGLALSAVLDAVGSLGDSAEFDAIVSSLTGGER